jgi:riboflavin kinase/FMN adenylyltransferase
MEHYTDLKHLQDVPHPVVMAIGVLDGVHLGHRALIERARTEAEAAGGGPWVLTFDPHPQRVLAPERAPALLTCTPHKLRLLEKAGVEGCVVLPFTQELAHWEPEHFLAHLAEQAPTLREVVVGRNWHFGHGARGDADMLLKLVEDYHFSAYVMDAIRHEGAPISSTRIRKSIVENRMDEAAAMLGRPFSMWGEVIHGARRGRELGFPTANLNPDNEVRPPAGIYAARAEVDGTIYDGAAYLARPGSASERRAEVEIHLFDVALDLYGKDIEVFFVRRLRDDRQFDSADALSKQIGKDCAEARAVLRGV